MKTYDYPRPNSEEITPRSLFLSRRRIMAGAGASLMAALLAENNAEAEALKTHPGPYTADLTPTPEEDATHYNNFYEFGMDKGDPSANSGNYKPFPWTLEIEGLVKHPQKINVEDLLRSAELEERIYRMRCVEAWSMVIPWDGIPLHKILEKAEPDDKAKYVAFESVVRPSEMPGQESAFTGISWPYVEGLRLDEALHPLTLLAVGAYGSSLPNANGAPLRLVVPWKYGFKGIKAIQKIRLVEQQPPTTWNQLAPQEYGFYANVNPHVDHPRWSQASERVIGARSLFGERRQPTLMFNGYEDYVSALYKGMDLHEYY
ncbi:protein-methionine-sulfoxide reductase catalytic subunit MsrP [Saccharibacter sp. 17.LH.SD]|uniref:protein-methionine-sulfoxide reductase catalytic subunit MsrP n=1 Tax=Saccharibacter sp. 17.LH.SD TaxID=2689393 RepID=UPI00137206CE|nr:protein-methionine-sulfoxide reductase catalytic subunit MsrP [Saccharibacter sp. 17.LH.SD]MXV44081.1 protein-methionine-sulfoxide reductase catalytic subunit MsrP [Saccharibacter sp. 17.LH.SD]